MLYRSLVSPSSFIFLPTNLLTKNCLDPNKGESELFIPSKH